MLDPQQYSKALTKTKNMQINLWGDCIKGKSVNCKQPTSFEEQTQENIIPTKNNNKKIVKLHHRTNKKQATRESYSNRLAFRFTSIQ